jgi:hypothetical protein
MPRVAALDNLLYLISGLYDGTDPYRKKKLMFGNFIWSSGYMVMVAVLISNSKIDNLVFLESKNKS